MKKYLLLFSVVILSSCQDGNVVEEAVLIGTETNAAETLEQIQTSKLRTSFYFLAMAWDPIKLL